MIIDTLTTPAMSYSLVIWNATFWLFSLPAKEIVPSTDVDDEY